MGCASRVRDANSFLKCIYTVPTFLNNLELYMIRLLHVNALKGKSRRILNLRYLRN